MQGTLPGARRRGRPRTAWIDNIKTWTGLSVEESIRITDDRDKWRKYVHGVANPRIENGLKTEQDVPVLKTCTSTKLLSFSLAKLFVSPLSRCFFIMAKACAYWCQYCL